MEQNLSIQIEGKTYELPSGATFGDAAALRTPSAYPALGAVMRNRVYSLREKIPEDGEVQFMNITSEEGARIYARSASFVLVRAAREVFPGATVLIDHSLNRSLYCEITWQRKLSPADLSAVERRMHEIVSRDEPFEPVSLQAGEARQMLLTNGRQDTVALLDEDEFHGYCSGWMTDTYYGALLPSTGFLTLFALRYYLPGFLLMMPNAHSPEVIPAWVELPKLSAVFYDTARWERILGVTRMVDLNDTIDKGGSRDLVRISEARQDRLIAGIAETIKREHRRVVLIAGPSSSGKTTFANRLLVHLKAGGLKPLALSLDDYYLDRDLVPLEEDGKPDLEKLEALNVELFEEQLTALLGGEEVELPRFDFITKRSVFSGRKTLLQPGQPLVIEGIHGLNDRLSFSIPAEYKYRIFVSALSQLNIDDHNRVSTTDFRLLRRIVRDSRTRGHDPKNTIESWPSVHRGENNYIFPNQENADVMFNSALLYEMAALRTHALPQLMEIPLDHPSRVEAERLMAFLRLVKPLPCEDEIPPTSIVREFIGGNTFYYVGGALLSPAEASPGAVPLLIVVGAIYELSARRGVLHTPACVAERHRGRSLHVLYD
jgi:uridine kinase